MIYIRRLCFLLLLMKIIGVYVIFSMRIKIITLYFWILFNNCNYSTQKQPTYILIKTYSNVRSELLFKSQNKTLFFLKLLLF